MKVLILEETRKSRVLAATLWKEQGMYYFRYEQNYLHRAYATALGPDLPLSLDTIRSKKFFRSLEDLIPDKRSSSYNDYCLIAGISPLEKDPLVLLSTIGNSGTTKFVFQKDSSSDYLSSHDIRSFRQKLNLSQRDFSAFFEIPIISLQKLEQGTPGQIIAKRYIEQFIIEPSLLLPLLKKRGMFLHSTKQKDIRKLTELLSSYAGHAIHTIDKRIKKE